MRLCLLSIALVLLACGDSVNSPNSSLTNRDGRNTAGNRTNTVPVFTYEIVKAYPHDQKAFTQGLIFHDGFLYESTGGSRARGDDFYSSLRKVEIESGKVLQKYDLPPEFFGEGIALLNGQIYQLTWREMTGFVYNIADFKLLREFRYTGEGWGLTEDGTNLYMSDGTHVIRVVEPESFRTLRTIVVKDERGDPVMRLNELEWVRGEIWANIWETGMIIRIDPTGKVIGRIDLEKLAADEKKSSPDADVLNGIAYDEASDRIFVTGKKWRRLFEIKVEPKQS